MKKFKIYLLIVASFIFLQSCGTIKEGFSSQKKNSSDEFLVEKKSPLVLPPNFDELPTPKINEVESEENSNKIKSLINTNEDSILSTEKNQSDQNLENSILKKIKNN